MNVQKNNIRRQSYNANNDSPQEKRWYQTWWGIVLIIFLVLVVGIVVWFIVLYIDITGKLYRGEFDPRTLSIQKQPPYNMDEVIDPTDPMLGSAEAPIKIVEFGDFLCPVCRQSYPVMRELAAEHPDKVAIYWRNFPILDLVSVDLANAAECAHLQGKFWPLHDRLFQGQDTIDASNIRQVATQVGLDSQLFDQCFTNRTLIHKIQDDYELAEKVQASGTPTFMVNGYKIQGHVPKQVWLDIISKLE